MNVLTMWLAIDHSDRENGCLRVIRGSHKQGLFTVKKDATVDNVLGSYTHRDEDIDQSQVVDIVLKPGGKCSLFLCYLYRFYWRNFLKTILCFINRC